jgi:phosphatidylinositol kinase/protein kinase (PI-3  family)
MVMLTYYIHISGTFRIACEIAMRVLRENSETIMSVMETFIHDPLVEWTKVNNKCYTLLLPVMTFERWLT